MSQSSLFWRAFKFSLVGLCGLTCAQWWLSFSSLCLVGYTRSSSLTSKPESKELENLCHCQESNDSPKLRDLMWLLPFSLLSHVWLFCDPMDCSPPGFSVHGISQARILEWVAISFYRGYYRPRDRICISCIGWQILNPCTTREIWKSCWVSSNSLSSFIVMIVWFFLSFILLIWLIFTFLRLSPHEHGV